MNFLLMLLRLMQVKNMTDQTDENKPDAPTENQSPEQKEEKFGLVDDLVFLLFLVPMVGVFLPQFRDDIKAGFDVLSNMPDWFSFVIVLGIVSLFGFRKQLADVLSNFTNFRKK